MKTKMSNTLPIPQSPETQRHESLLKVVARAEELLEGVNSAVEDYQVPDLGMPGEDRPEDASLDYASAHRSVTFTFKSPEGETGVLGVDQITQQDSLITEVMTSLTNSELSVPGKNVVDFKTYIIDKNPDGTVSHATYRESQKIVDDNGTPIEETNQGDKPEPIDLDDPEWAYKMLDRVSADYEMDTLEPKLDVTKLRELLGLMDSVDVNTRTVEVGTVDVGPEGLDELDLRGIA